MASTYQPRIVDRRIAQALGALGAVVLEGPKACGKTETARQHARSEVLLDIDLDAAEAAALDPTLVLAGEIPRLIDEWQRVPPVWDAVRRAVDERSTSGQFLLTGSAAPADSVRRHSGAGRLAVVRMRPMCLYERGLSEGAVSMGVLLDGQAPESGRTEMDVRAYAEQVVIGGWPGLLGASVEEAMEFTRGYVDMIADHDVSDVSGTRRDPHMVGRFLHAYAQLSGHPASLATIVARARGEGADDPARGPTRWAAEPYLDALRRLMVIDELPAWDPKLRSRTRLMRTPKRHLVDPSLAAAVLECDPSRLLDDLETFGFLFESLAARDVRVYAGAHRASVFHYRERAGRLEVDLIVERSDGAWVAIEVKLGGRQVDAAAASLLKLSESRVSRAPSALVVLTATPYAYQRDDGVWVVPLAVLGP